MLTLKAKDQLKLDVVLKVHGGKITFNHALKILDVSERTLFRYLKSYSETGAIFVQHKNKHRHPVNKISSEFEQKIIALCKDKYHDFNRTHALEKLTQIENISLKKSTFNDLCNRHNLLNKNKRRKKKIARSRRERMKEKGLMIQMDGSPHRWFGLRKTCLVIAIDDATSEILYGEFSPTETTFACMNVMKDVLKNHGVFQVLYVDKAGLFGRNELNHFDAVKREGFSSLKFCLLKFNIHTIFAHSPEAKGRVERAFKTLQDRLPPELRLANINTVKEATRYFNHVFLPQFNQQFSLKDSVNESSFVSVLKSINIDEEFYMIEKRRVKNDHTFNFKNKVYDLLISEENHSGKEIEIRSYPNGNVKYFINDKEVGIKTAGMRTA